MPGDAEEAQREAIAPGPLGRDSRDLLHWTSYLEDEKGCWGQSKRESWEVETCGEGGEAEINGVLEAALEQSFG